jgi:hypothetical protein
MVRALGKWIAASGKKRTDYLFPGRGGDWTMSTRQLSHLVKIWITEAGLDPKRYTIESLRRTKALHILRGTGDLQTVRALLGHVQIESTGMPVVGLLNSACPETFVDRLRAFRQGLKDNGYVEGDNVTIAYRWAERQNGRPPAPTNELLSRLNHCRLGKCRRLRGKGRNLDNSRHFSTAQRSGSMLMSKANQQSFQETLKNLPKKTHSAYLLNPSVKLLGKALKTKKDFTGSGVIAYVSEGTTTIVTAKHNLTTLAEVKDPPPWDDDLVAQFIKNVKILWDGNMEFNKEPKICAKISDAIPVKPNPSQPWAYDVMILKSTDPNLVLHASLWSVYSKRDDPNNLIDLGFLCNQKLYLAKKDHKDNPQLFIQTGYGFAREEAEDGKKTKMPAQSVLGDNIGGRLQFRTCEPKANKTVQVYAQRDKPSTDYDTYVDAIQLTADSTSSSAPGDSGGPLFVVTGPRLFLIGTSYGADLSTAKEPCPPKGQLRVNNISTSLEYCYRQGILSLD